MLCYAAEALKKDGSFTNLAKHTQSSLFRQPSNLQGCFVGERPKCLQNAIRQVHLHYTGTKDQDFRVNTIGKIMPTKICDYRGGFIFFSALRRNRNKILTQAFQANHNFFTQAFQANQKIFTQAFQAKTKHFNKQFLAKNKIHIFIDSEYYYFTT